jgi:hypothetical protein
LSVGKDAIWQVGGFLRIKKENAGFLVRGRDRSSTMNSRGGRGRGGPGRPQNIMPPSHLGMGGRFPPQMPTMPPVASNFWMSSLPMGPTPPMMPSFPPTVQSIQQFPLGMQMRGGLSQHLPFGRPGASLMAGPIMAGMSRPSIGRGALQPMSTILGMNRIPPSNFGRGALRGGHVSRFTRGGSEFRLLTLMLMFSMHLVHFARCLVQSNRCAITFDTFVR